jgi:hypothetical protein
MAGSVFTIVEHYVFSALRYAQVEEQTEVVLGAFVPQFPGLVAFGSDSHELALSLYGQLLETVRLRLQSGEPLPVIDGIDLNSEANQVLASYDPHATQGPHLRVVSSEEFEQILAEEDRVAS